MMTYSFDQLDERGQANAINKYRDETQRLFENATNGPQPFMDSRVLFDGWRFSVNGERIA